MDIREQSRILAHCKKQKEKPNNFQNHSNCLQKGNRLVVKQHFSQIHPSPPPGLFNEKFKFLYKSHKHFFCHHQSIKPLLKFSFPFTEYSVIGHFKESQVTQETSTHQLNVKFVFWLLQEFSVYFQEELEMLHYDYGTSPKYEHVAYMSKWILPIPNEKFPHPRK